MKLNNKGFSLVEMIIVMAIIVILASLSMVTFNMANSRRPEKVRNTFIYCADYAKNYVKAQDKDSCMVIVKSPDGEYFAVYGKGSGATQAELASAGDTGFTARSSAGGELTLDEIEANPYDAADFKNLGKYVQIWYNDGSNDILIGSESNPCLFVKYRKYDGAAVLGYGEFKFSEYTRSNATSIDDVKIQSTIVLEQSTGVCHSKND